MKKAFPTRAILSVTTGRLLTKSPKPGDNGIGDMYELLGWMTNDSPFTHQLGRFAEECKPWLLRWFPELATVEAEIVAACEAGRVEAVCDAMEVRFGKTIEVERIPQDDHEKKHPYDELVAMRGTDEGILVL
jgi:hypothetical protein